MFLKIDYLDISLSAIFNVKKNYILSSVAMHHLDVNFKIYLDAHFRICK